MRAVLVDEGKSLLREWVKQKMGGKKLEIVHRDCSFKKFCAEKREMGW